MDVYAVSNIGKRKQNQDSYWVAKLAVSGHENARDLRDEFATNAISSLDIGGISEAAVMCVCDGMGGLADGQVASSTTLDSVRGVILGGDLTTEGITHAISTANKELYNYGQAHGERLGTTITLIILLEGRYRIIHAGDSRCYKIARDSSYEVLTEDHTAFNKFLLSNELTFTAEGAPLFRGEPKNIQEVKRWRSQLTRCIGVRPTVRVEVYEGDYNKDELFLISSDGFWHKLESDPQWAYKLRESDSHATEHLSSLIESFKESGETDNLTVTVVRG